jgi:hypothetical protein
LIISRKGERSVDGDIYGTHGTLNAELIVCLSISTFNLECSVGCTNKSDCASAADTSVVASVVVASVVVASVVVAAAA